MAHNLAKIVKQMESNPGLIIRNRSVLPTLFLLNVFTALKGTHLYIFI